MLNQPNFVTETSLSKIIERCSTVVALVVGNALQVLVDERLNVFSGLKINGTDLFVVTDNHHFFCEQKWQYPNDIALAGFVDNHQIKQARREVKGFHDS